MNNPDIDLVSGDFWGRNPHPELTWLRANAPVYFDGRVWGIATHADVREVSLHPERLIDQVAGQGECDAVTDLASWLPMHVIGGAEGDGESGLSPADIENVIHDSLLILIGGDETTRHVISGGPYQLLTNPGQKQLLIDDPSLIPTAVEEMLRWVSPIKNMARTVATDTELHGQKLTAGEKVLLLYPSANRDEKVFADPFTFDVTRTPNDHLAFGLGAHFCLGNNLARLELRCFFETLLRRLPDIELADRAEPGYRPANFVSGYEHMPVRFRARVSA